MILVGCDPGLTGAACAFDVMTGPIDLVDLPIIPDGKGKQVDVLAFTQWLHRVNAARVVIEQQWVRPIDGAVGAFRAGVTFGQLRATVQVNGIALSMVAPARWKAWLELSSDKEQSRLVAIAKFPSFEDRLSRKKDHNRSEAVLIALWGAAHWRGLAAGTI